VSAVAGKFVLAKLYFTPASARPAQVFVILTPQFDSKATRKQSIFVATPASGDFYSFKLVCVCGMQTCLCLVFYSFIFPSLCLILSLSLACCIL
jgi:hypothetical protein